MKHISTLIAVIGIYSISFSQPSAEVEQTPDASVAPSCSMLYSEDSSLLEFSGAMPVKCTEITFTALPPLTQSLTTINLEFGRTGSFTFKKDPDLKMHGDVDVYIEDMLTGKIFDLKTSESYSFNVNRRIPNRFVLHIDKMISKYTLLSSLSSK